MSDSLGIPGYRLIRSVGSGASGEVFEVEELELGRRVALKLLRSATPSAESLARFRRERELLARIAHPNVLRIHTAGSSRGRLYVVTELLPGRTVANLCAEKVSIGEALRLTLEAADGLGALHAADLVHRDVKPANLLLDEEGAVKVADLGLATGGDLHTLTQAGELTGSPAYMSPEGCRGKRLRDPTCDVYSLGVTFYELLTGQLPHQARTVLELIAARVSNPAPDPVLLNPAIPAALGKVCQRAMAGEPSERYPDASAFAAALRQVPAPAPRGAPGGGPAAAVLGALALTLALALGLTLLGLGPTPPATPPPDASAARASPSPGASGSSPSPSPEEDALNVLARRLAEGQEQAWTKAQAWAAAHAGAPPLEVARLEDARIRGALLGPPAQTFTRALGSPFHVPWALALGPDEVLWGELCRPQVPLAPHTYGALGLLSSAGQFEAFDWRGGQLSAVEPSGRYFAGWTGEGEGRLYLRSDSALQLLHERPQARITALATAPGRVALGLASGSLVCLDGLSGEVLWEREGAHSGPIVALTAQGGGLFSGSQGAPPLSCTSLDRGQPVAWSAPAHLGPAHFLIPSAGREEILCGLQLSHLVYGLRPGAARTFAGRALTPLAAKIPMSARWSPDGVGPRAALVIAGRYLCVIGGEHNEDARYSQQRLFELASGREVCAAGVPGQNNYTLTLSPDGLYLAIGGVQSSGEGVVTLRPLTLAPR